MNVHEDDGSPGGLRSVDPGVGSCKGVLEVVIACSSFVGGFGEEEDGVEAAGAGDGQHLHQPPLPRIRYVPVLERSSL